MIRVVVLGKIFVGRSFPGMLQVLHGEPEDGVTIPTSQAIVVIMQSALHTCE